MQRLATLFLNLFVVAGCLDLATELLAGVLPAPPLASLRGPVWAAVLLLGGLLYLALGFDRSLPKRLLLPPIVFAFWTALAFWPFPALLGGARWPLAAAAGQVLLGVGVLRRWHRALSGAGQPPLLRFRLRGTLLFLACNALLLPLLLVAIGLATADCFLDGQTSGFMRVLPTGIYMTERLYQRDEKVVRLVGMVHIGEEGYYRRLADSVGGGRTVVLAEGVSDRDGLLRHRLDYGGVGGVLGLVSQERLQFDGRMIDAKEMAAAGQLEGREKPDVVRADLDVAQFDPQTVAFLNAVGEMLAGGGAMVDVVRDYNTWVEAEMTPELQGILLDDILHRRNRELLRHLERGVAGYDTVVIPWGAMHMPVIEAALQQQGFAQTREYVRRSIDFARLPYSKLFSSIAED